MANFRIQAISTHQAMPQGPVEVSFVQISSTLKSCLDMTCCQYAASRRGLEKAWAYWDFLHNPPKRYIPGFRESSSTVVMDCF